MEEADRIGVELLPLGLVAFHDWQATDAVILQTPMQRRASEQRSRGLERVQAVVELWVDAMPASQLPHILLTMLKRSPDRLCRRGAPV